MITRWLVIVLYCVLQASCVSVKLSNCVPHPQFFFENTINHDLTGGTIGVKCDYEFK